MPTPSVSSKEGNRLTWCGFEYASALLGPCALLVMDNLPALRSTAAREAIRPAGAELRFLPPTVPISTRSGLLQVQGRPSRET